MSESNDTPAWLVPVLSFVAGCVVTFALLSPSVVTPDYQRGQSAGYQSGFDDGYTIGTSQKHTAK